MLLETSMRLRIASLFSQLAGLKIRLTPTSVVVIAMLSVLIALPTSLKVVEASTPTDFGSLSDLIESLKSLSQSLDLLIQRVKTLLSMDFSSMDREPFLTWEDQSINTPFLLGLENSQVCSTLGGQ
jgi:hypothetical protein